MELGEIYAIAKTSTNYSEFLTELGVLVGILRTDARSQDLNLIDLLRNQTDAIAITSLNPEFIKSMESINKALKKK